MELSMGIRFDEESLEQLDNLINKIKELNNEIAKLNSNEILGHVNNITINTSAFVGNEADAKELANKIVEILNNDELRS